LLLGASVVALVLTFQGIAALPVVVAQFVVHGAMFQSVQALPGDRPLPVRHLESRERGGEDAREPNQPTDAGRVVLGNPVISVVMNKKF
jgi:hypothetical protein